MSALTWYPADRNYAYFKAHTSNIVSVYFDFNSLIEIKIGASTPESDKTLFAHVISILQANKVDVPLFGQRVVPEDPEFVELRITRIDPNQRSHQTALVQILDLLRISPE